MRGGCDMEEAESVCGMVWYGMAWHGPLALRQARCSLALALARAMPCPHPKTPTETSSITRALLAMPYRLE